MTAIRVTQRMNFTTTAPRVFKAVLALDAAAREGLDPVIVELVQIRASQLNRCAYCIDYHTRDARKAGETEERIYQLDAWEDAGRFTARSRLLSLSPRPSPCCPAVSRTRCTTRPPSSSGKRDWPSSSP